MRSSMPNCLDRWHCATGRVSSMRMTGAGGRTRLLRVTSRSSVLPADPKPDFLAWGCVADLLGSVTMSCCYHPERATHSHEEPTTDLQDRIQTCQAACSSRISCLHRKSHKQTRSSRLRIDVIWACVTSVSSGNFVHTLVPDAKKYIPSVFLLAICMCLSP